MAETVRTARPERDVDSSGVGEAASPVPAASTAGPPVDLKKRGLRASLWVLIGFSAGHVLRLGSSLVLTRLLFREAFGLMALVNTFLFGLAMFSDLGIGPSIVQSKRGDERAFLNTAWTVQVIRGLFILVGTLVIAWPASRFYSQPQLAVLVPAIGLNGLIMGLNSTSVYTLSRHLEQSKLITLDLGTQVLALIVTVVWAWIHPSAWALLGGNVAGSTAKMIATHVLLPGPRNRFQWEPAAAKELIHFGRWIFISSILTFLAGKLDGLVLGKLLTIGELGVYSIADNIARLPFQVAGGLASSVIFPLISASFRRNDGSFHRNLLRARATLILPTVAVALGLAIFGQSVIRLLYDARYQDAGWMVRVLSAGTIAAVIGTSCGAVFFAVGNSFVNMWLEGIRVIFLVTGMIVGGHFFGKPGLVVGVSAGWFLTYPFWAIALQRQKFWQPKLDLSVLLGAYCLLAVGLYFWR